jgi:hypothetical protein
MPDIVRALGISAGLLLLVVVLIVIVSMVAVNRGAAEMEPEHHPVAEVPVATKEGAAAVPAKAAKPAAAAAAEVSVIQILLFGTGLFVLTVILLVALSLIEHMG